MLLNNSGAVAKKDHRLKTDITTAAHNDAKSSDVYIVTRRWLFTETLRGMVIRIH